MDTIRIAGTVNDSIVDGPGIRYTVFTQGCPHHCPGCHNPESHDMAGGKLVKIGAIVEAIKSNPLLDGVTLSGGEPMCQGKACEEIAKAAKAQDLNVWMYTGFKWEYILEKNAEEWNGLLEYTDVLVDGAFLQKEKSLELKFRGSRNQRLIDVKKSMAAGAIILWEPPVW